MDIYGDRYYRDRYIGSRNIAGSFPVVGVYSQLEWEEQNVGSSAKMLLVYSWGSDGGRSVFSKGIL